MTSANCRCLLADDGSEKTISIRAWCTEDELLTYSLGTESAVVYVTTLVKAADGLFEAMVDHMEKIDRADLPRVQSALRMEAELAAVARGETDVTGVLTYVNHPSRKRARTLAAYPSDTV